jgi:hypothetical protein
MMISIPTTAKRSPIAPSAIAPLPRACHPEAIRQGWLKGLNVNSGKAGSVQAPLCSGHPQVAISPVAGPK